MTSTPPEGEPGPKAPLKPRPRQSLEDGPFVLRSLLDEVPLSADGTDEDIRINCTTIYMSEHPPRSSSTSSRYPQTRQTRPENPSSSSPRDSAPPTSNHPVHLRAHAPEFNRYLCSLGLERRASCATGPSPSTLYPR
ncbi:hypothetical protein EDB80DRAFT_254304 [Ilyonectria destructans]|nr:hypothetical protein EDB80DRAFT_254304 [Ilyonectria destructans]